MDDVLEYWVILLALVTVIVLLSIYGGRGGGAGSDYDYWGPMMFQVVIMGGHS
jgi:hypothetical protein